MRRPTTRQIAIPLVVLMVALAGCSGGGGGDGGNGATPTATATDDGGGMSPTATATESGGTATDAQTSTTAQGGGDTATSDPGSETTSDSGTETTSSSGSDDFSLQRHSAAVRNAGSYTIDFRIDGLFGGAGGSGNTVIEGTQKAIVSSGEHYATLDSSSGGQQFSLEYYRPPNSDTVYQNIGGQVQETTMNQALLFNFSSLDATATGQSFPDLRNAGTAQTSMGTATKYVVDSVDQLPDATRDQYGSIENVSFVLFVDQDTGIISKYDYQLTYTQEGEEVTVEFVIEVSGLGSTTIEKPDWAP